MKSYLLYAPRNAAARDDKAVQGLSVIRDAFSWTAFFVPVAWFLYFRCWLAAIADLIVMTGVLVLARFLPVEAGSVLLVLLVVRAFIALEANAVRGWTLRRKGFRLVDVVVAANLAEAERALLGRWLANEDMMDVAGHPVRNLPDRHAPIGVVGLFPEPEGGR